MSGASVNVAVNAVLNPDGSVACNLTCEGQQATVTFTGTEVLFEVPGAAAEGS